MKEFGIIGYPLEHSLSPAYFRQKFAEQGIADAVYSAYPIESISDFPLLTQQHHFIGLNVTAPYKETVLKYIDSIDPIARQIGAVNVIRFNDGFSTGYNTDYTGFICDLRQWLPNDTIRTVNALIFGSGGASKAIQYALRSMNISYKVVSRNATSAANILSYAQISPQVLHEHRLLINCTPLGMFPKTDDCVRIDYSLLSNEHYCYDLIYNPKETLFLKRAAAAGANTRNGYGMFTCQAEAAWQIWKADN